MIEKFIEFIAPDECIACQKEGLCLCESCAESMLEYKKPACMYCNELNQDGRVCIRCRKRHEIYKATIAYRYKGILKDLINLMKYQGRRSIARQLALAMPKLDFKKNTLITFVPSDGRARRRRGFDQARLIARYYAKNHSSACSNLLARGSHERQVGKTRQARFDNVKGNFVATKNIAGAQVILIDDVVTTGATVSECARVLKDAGAKRVEVLAVAKK